MGLLAKSGVRWIAMLGASLGIVLGQSGPALADGGLDITSDTTYEIFASEGLIRVATEYTLKNTLRNEDDGYYITRYFYQTFTVPIPETAVNVVAANGTTDLAVEVEQPEDSSFNHAIIKLDRYIYSGQTQTISFSYDLPSEEVRSDRFVRVNSAFSSFGMWGDADPGQATVRLVIPDGFSVETVGDDMSYTVTPDGPQWVAEDIADPDDWYVWVAARDDSGLATTRLSVDGRDVVIRSWPDDPAWEQFTIDQFSDRLPLMEELIGVPWPVEGELEIIETVTPSLYGAAGWFLTDQNVIEITEHLDEQVMLHEFAHAWFSRNNFEHRWLSEGLAEEFSYRTLEVDGEPLGPFGVFPPVSADPFALNTWEAFSSSQADNDDDPDTYGYNASAYVMRQITREIGMDGLRAVLQAAAVGDLAYPGEEGEATPTRFSGPRSTDWKRFLDLVEQLGESDSIVLIFDRYVVTDSQRDLLEKRREAREEYELLETHSGVWAAPVSVRNAMEAWEFGLAGTLMADAEAVLVIRDEIARQAIRLDVVPPASLEDDYEDAFHDVHWVIGKAEAQLAAVEAVTEAVNAVGAERGIWASFGLWGADLEADLDQLRTTFESGDNEAAMFQSVAVIAEVDAGRGVGMKRAGVAAAGVMLSLGLGLVGNRLVRRRRGAAGLVVDSEGTGTGAVLVEHPIFEIEVEDFSSWVPRAPRELVGVANSTVVANPSDGAVNMSVEGDSPLDG